MKRSSVWTSGIVAGLSMALAASVMAGSSWGKKASFVDVDRKAKAGEALSVVFFGGSLTYGANASDPPTTSYRGLMSQYLKDKYPKARFSFYDAAIGGTGSDLGMFRLERDVLVHKPDLVFLDFMANDGYDGTNVETCCFYETLVRRMVGEGIPVEQMYFGFKWQFGKTYTTNNLFRRDSYQKIAAAYHVGQGDLYPVMQEAITNGVIAIEKAWPFDQAHPDDPGYVFFFEAAKKGFEAAIKDRLVCTVPEKPVFGQMTDVRRIRLADAPLTNGWSVAKTYRTSLWFDGLSSRWMGDVAMCDAKNAGSIQPLRVEFEGNFLGFFGEASDTGLDFNATLDGKPLPYETMSWGKLVSKPVWPFNQSHGKGNLFMWRRDYPMLPSGKHVLELSPVIAAGVTNGQLRIESVCAAKFEPVAVK